MTQEAAKKIIVDEDWKTQVEREREAATGGDADANEMPDTAQAAAANVPLPPASLSYLVSSLYFQTTMLLGLIPDPATGKVEKDLAVAKHTIDLLEMLEQKTEGNRTPDETADLEAMLHQLRMAYVQAAG